MKKYLLVEGITDVAFVKYICLKNGITNNFNDFKQNKNQYTFGNKIIINIDGQGNLEKELNFLKNEEHMISNIFIIQDADNDIKKSKEQIEETINNSLIEKNKIKYFLTPNDKDTGNLETLLLSSIENNPVLECFDEYAKCLKENEEVYPKALDKGKLHAYTMYSQKGENLYKPVDSFIKKDIDTKLWDITNDKFKPIMSFVLEIFKD